MFKNLFKNTTAGETEEVNLDPAKMPQHIAIIMDGNGRWAQRRGLPRVAGHRRGMEVVKDITKAARRQSKARRQSAKTSRRSSIHPVLPAHPRA